MTTSSIPLFKFPSLILTEIICLTDPDALVRLALCSQRMHHAVKRENRKFSQSCELHVVAGDHQLAAIRKNSLDYDILGAMSIENGKSDLITIRLRSQRVIAGMLDGVFTTYWNDPVFGYRQVREFLFDLFNLDITTIFFRNASIWLLEWMHSLQTPVPNVISYKERLSAEDYQFLMSTCKAEVLFLTPTPPENFNPLDAFSPLTVVRIDYGYWLQIEHLIRMDCVELYVNESTLDSYHLNIFLKHWVGGGFERLRCLFIRSQFPLVRETVFHQLDSKITLVEHERPYVKRTKIRCSIPANTMDIKRSDGRVASVKVEGNCVLFMVWPDYS